MALWQRCLWWVRHWHLPFPAWFSANEGLLPSQLCGTTANNHSYVPPRESANFHRGKKWKEMKIITNSSVKKMCSQVAVNALLYSPWFSVSGPFFFFVLKIPVLASFQETRQVALSLPTHRSIHLLDTSHTAPLGTAHCDREKGPDLSSPGTGAVPTAKGSADKDSCSFPADRATWLN